MNVIYDNYLIDATISATNEDENRPITNIIHNYMELAFYSTSYESIITVEFDNSETIDCISFDYHNIETMIVQFYDVFNNLLGTEIINVNDDCNFHIFDTPYENVKTIILNVTAPDYYLYIGAVFVGEYIEFPRFIQSPQYETEINDDNFQSSGGQASGNRKRNLDNRPIEFRNISNDELEDFKIYLTYVQNSIPHFIDLYPDAHDEFPPFYGIVNIKRIPTPKRRISDFKHNFRLTYKEAK